MKADAAEVKPVSNHNTGTISGIFRLRDCPILVNLIIDSRFSYRALYRLTSLAMKFQGSLDACNEEIATFSFPKSGILGFIEGVGFETKIIRTAVSPRENGISKVNLRFGIAEF